MTDKRGSPATLFQAILNAREEYFDRVARLTLDGIRDKPIQAKLTEAHVRDYLAQKFSAALLEADENTTRTLSGLWTCITGEPLGGDKNGTHTRR